MPEIRANSLKYWLLAIRMKTLAAAVVPVCVGSALAAYGGSFRWQPALSCLAFAVLMQIAANLINDLYDYLKGSDGADRLGPARAVAQGWITIPAMKAGIAVVALAACAAGSTLIFYGGWAMVAVGAFCLVFAYFYTSGPYPLAYNGLGDAAVIVFFGIVATGFTCYVQTLRWTTELTLTSLSVGLVVNTLLAVNNYRDRDTDRRAGKRTLVVRFGEPFGRYLYLFSGALAVLLIWAAFLPESGGIFVAAPVTLYLLPHVFTWRKLGQIRKGTALNALLGETSRNMLMFAALVLLGLLLP